MSTWREMLDGFEDNIVACTLTDDELRVEFDSGYGGHEGVSFTAWSEKWVYFPVVYDGSEWIGRAPRNVCDIACQHEGGE